MYRDGSCEGISPPSPVSTRAGSNTRLRGHRLFPRQGFTGVGIESYRAGGWDFTPIPAPAFARGRLFSRRGFTGVCIENKRACGWDFTPIPAFPRQGGRSLRLGFSAIPAIFSNELYMRCSNTYPCQPVEGEGVFCTGMVVVRVFHPHPSLPPSRGKGLFIGGGSGVGFGLAPAEGA